MQLLSDTKICISVIIVNYKVPEFLRETIRSLRDAVLYDQTEVIIVDNASRDRSQSIITSEFPEVIWIQMKNNVGFGTACNIGVKRARGTYVLLLNPDTVVSKNTLSVSVDFMESHPDVGLMGPKILNPDGSLQASCRRSFPSPADALCHFAGLDKLFPKSKLFGKYNLTYKDPDNSSQVDAISGSYMITTKSLFEKIGGFDERFFMYGEDLDLCWRIRDAGYKVWYHPGTQIIHRKGKSSAKSKIRSKIAFYEAMVIFSEKYKKLQKGFIPNWLVFAGIIVQALLSISGNLFNYIAVGILDLLIINVTLWLSLLFRFSGIGYPYNFENFVSLLTIHAVISICFVFMFAYNGIYSKKKYSVKNALLSGVMASVLFMSVIYFLKPFAFSRIAFGISAILITGLLVLWREVMPKVEHSFRQLIYSPNRTIIIGNGAIAQKIIKDIEVQKSGIIKGIVWPESGLYPGEFEGYPVLNDISGIIKVLKDNKVDVLIIATDLPWYSSIIEMLSSLKLRNLIIQWVPHEYCRLKLADLPQNVQLNNFSV